MLSDFPFNFIVIPGIIIWVAMRNRRNLKQGLLPWYKNIHKPKWTPSGRLIGEAWVFIYVTTGLGVLWFWNVPAFTWFHFVVAAELLVVVYLHYHWHKTMFIKHDLKQAHLLLKGLFFAVIVAFLLIMVPSPIAAFIVLPYVIWMGLALKLSRAILELNTHTESAEKK